MEFDDIRKEEIKGLILKHLRGELTDGERLELDVWLAQSTENRDFLDKELSKDELREGIKVLQNKNEDAIRRKVEDAILGTEREEHILLPQQPASRPSRRIWAYTAAAAAFIGVVVLAGGFLFRDSRTSTSSIASTTTTPSRQDVAPGGNKAILTLANGKQVVLDNIENGQVSTEGTSQVVKLDSGRLAYTSAAGDADAPVVYNTLVTPKAGQFEITLPDGTRVWLNNASRLYYPTVFRKGERLVELSGEAYFQVAKDVEKPFVVKVLSRNPGEADVKVQVLGTEFNISAYQDEKAVKATLINGSVRVTNDAQHVLLQPGEQAAAADNGGLKVAEVNTRSVIAWRRGFFNFDNSDLPTVMRQLARWYDIDISYEGSVPAKSFDGNISRNSNLSEILKVLERNQVHFRLEGKKLVVTP